MIRHFSIKELVPKHIYEQWGDMSWWFLDFRAIKTLEWLRDELGSCTVNNWAWGGSYDQSGLRTYQFYQQNSLTPKYIAKELVAESFSQHKYGRAFDCKFTNHKAEDVREFIKTNWNIYGYEWPITIEEDTNWVHFDTRNRPYHKVYTFKQ
ncbi:MAG: hypothetical protein GY714_01750 [Desulfobacterales bacterium]|nr:hypothetical protein [Desulfobacterales bacterium]